MPMMKTASVGTTNITNIQTYLLKTQRQEFSRHQLEWESYALGQIQLSSRQVGHLKDYLGQASRGLAVDVSEDLSARNWARQMDLTRMLYQHDKPTKQGRSRSYYHFILSPNPDDDCSLDTLRAYAKAWCEENFRMDERLHEYAVVYHDDNAKGVLHAHVVVNVTNKKTGKKLHLDNDQTVALQISAQEIGKRFGLTPIREEMQTTIGARTTQPIYLDRREREILNKGGYSWKWELRKFISDIAPLCNDYDDFKWKLNRAGYDVVRSEKTGYLTYTHRNGAKVKDSRLGARFYMEALERVFNHEQVLADQTYSSWELIKISKGEIPWKEDIRRAIDAVAPTVMSIPELQRELDVRYGIRLTVNRRGITYSHASGFKTRDIGIGFRYTLEGLRQNAVLDMTLPRLRLQELEQGARSITRHYMPRCSFGVSKDASAATAAWAVFHDVSNLMIRNGLNRLDDIPTALNARYEALRDVKNELVDIRSQVMRWNHLAVLQSRSEKDAAFLKDANSASDPSLFNETLLRYMRITVYLNEQANGVDPRAMQKALSSSYEEKLKTYQDQVSQLDQDNNTYRNYLVGQSLGFIAPESGSVSAVSARDLVTASQVLSKHRIRDFFHLRQVLSDYETRIDLTKFRLSKAEEEKRQLDFLRSDIRDFEELKLLVPNSDTLQRHSASLGLEAQMIRFQEVSRRLTKAGVLEGDHRDVLTAHREAALAYASVSKEYERLSSEYMELRQALNVCQEVSESIRGLNSVELDLSQKPSSEGGEGASASMGRYLESSLSSKVPSGKVHSDEPAQALPIEEARKRLQERLQGSPERSKRIRSDWIR